MRRVAPLFAAALMVGALTSGVVPASTVGASPLNGRILFTRCDETDGCQIYTANPDGSAIRRVTKHGESFLGDWSPNGKKIAYDSDASGDLAIWIADADGSNARQLTPDDPNSNNFWPRFSPDGQRVIFANCLGDDCDGGIASVRTDGSHFHLITPNSHYSYNVADLSPDQRHLAYMRWHKGGVKMAIYVSRADGTHDNRITAPRLQGWYPDWSPTGERIAFASDNNFDRPAPTLYSVEPDGDHLLALTHPPYPHSDWAPAYSPDGAKILFSSDRRYDDFCCGDLFRIDARGGHLHRIPLPFDAYEPRWGTAPPLPAGGGYAQTAFHAGGSPCDVVAALRKTPVCSSDLADR